MTDKLGFEDENDVPAPPTQSVKLDAGKSKFAKQAIQKQTFEKQVLEVHKQMEGRQQQAYELGLRFLDTIQDRTLKKGPIAKDLERETLNSIIKFAIEMNNDENEPDGMGSVSMLTLVLKSLLILRDNLNRVEDAAATKIEELQKKISEQNLKIQDLTNKSNDSSS